MLQAYRVLTSKDNVEASTRFQLCQAKEWVVTSRQTVGYLNVVPQMWNGETRRNFWSVKVVEIWNSLQADTLNSFKHSPDNFQGRGRKT